MLINQNPLSDWILLGEFAKRVGKTDNAVRIDINRGKLVFKVAKLVEGKYWINHIAFNKLIDDLDQIAA